MTRIDAHQHYWILQRGDYSWLTPAAGSLYRDFTPADLRDELLACSVDATVLVQAAATEDETRFLFGLAGQYASVAGIVGWVDFEADDVRERLQSLVRDGGGKLKGLRPMIQEIRDPLWLDRASLDAAFDAVMDHDLAFDALVMPQHLEALERRLRKHPMLRAVLDHAGKPDIARRGFEPWASRIERLARIDSLHCKLSGLLTEAAPGAGAAELDEFVAHVFACFGAERVIWGSDWPVLTVRTSYRQWLDTAVALVERHAPGQRESVFAGNAIRFYRLDVGARSEC